MTSWPHNLSKTTPDAAERTSTILKAAPTAHGVTFRVVKPWRSLPGASLVTTAPGQPGVWIEAYSHTNGPPCPATTCHWPDCSASVL
ncbi:hypothetical protein ACIQVR_27000 [Streptomyces xanthochromogenes]|uniref:hypothetical protein n=1 Tax=Streptomyces xanthochromogenes TaxID=67384 RepID=UPI003807A88C